MPKLRGILLTRNRLAEAFGVSLISVDNWTRAGCPYVQRARPGKPWQFDSAAVADWLLDRARQRDQRRGPLDAAQELARKHKETADQLAMKNQTLRAELTPAADALAAAEYAFAHVRSVVSALPAKVADAVALANTTEEVQQILSNAVWEVLDELSRTRVPAAAEPPGAESH